MLLNEIQPLGLHAAAKELGVDPFEVVRLLVVSDAVGTQWHVTPEQLETLRTVGGIESWWQNATLPSDDNPRRRLLRAAIDMLLKQAGDSSTRIDNLWRGLPAADQDLIRTAVSFLVQSGHLVTRTAPGGVQVSVNPDRQRALKKFTDGGKVPRVLADLLGE